MYDLFNNKKIDSNQKSYEVIQLCKNFVHDIKEEVDDFANEKNWPLLLIYGHTMIFKLIELELL